MGSSASTVSVSVSQTVMSFEGSRITAVICGGSLSATMTSSALDGSPSHCETSSTSVVTSGSAVTSIGGSPQLALAADKNVGSNEHRAVSMHGRSLQDSYGLVVELPATR